MAHYVSAAALHAARTLLKFNTFATRPERVAENPALKADERCIAIVIDLSTNVYKLVELRPELRYWQTRLFNDQATAPQLGVFMKKVRDAFEAIPRDDEPGPIARLNGPPQFRTVHEQRISKAAMEAVRYLRHHFVITPKKPTAIQDTGREDVTLAALIEAALGIDRATPAKALLEHWRSKLHEGQATKKEITACLRQAGILLDFMPHYGNLQEETKPL